MNNGTPLSRQVERDAEIRAALDAEDRKETLHRQISYVKSGMRLVGYVLLPVGLWIAAAVLFVSELLGIAEEVWGS